jgi:hypothetical protein
MLPDTQVDALNIRIVRQLVGLCGQDAAANEEDKLDSPLRAGMTT